MSNRYEGAGTTGPLRRGTGRGSGRRSTRPVDLEELGERSGRITALEEQKDPQRRSLFVDGEFVLGLDLETVIRCGFKAGQEVEGPALVQAYQLDMVKRAWDAGLTLLAASPRTVQELGRRLGRTYPPAAVEQVISRLEAAGWLDDRAYAESYIRSKREHGARRLLADLIRKGVDREVAAEAVQEALGEVDAAEQAREVAARRLARMGAVDRDSAQRRLVGYLARRGFGSEAIGRALSPLLAELPPAERRQGNRSGWRRVEADTDEQSSPGRGGSSAGGGSFGWGRSPGGSTLRRNSSLQRRRPLRSAHLPTDEEE